MELCGSRQPDPDPVYLSVSSRRLSASLRQHAVSLDLRGERRGPPWPVGISRVLSGLWRGSDFIFCPRERYGAVHRAERRLLRFNLWGHGSVLYPLSLGGGSSHLCDHGHGVLLAPSDVLGGCFFHRASVHPDESSVPCYRRGRASGLYGPRGGISQRSIGIGSSNCCATPAWAWWL